MNNRKLVTENTPLLLVNPCVDNSNNDAVISVDKDIEKAEAVQPHLSFDNLPANVIIHIATYLTLQDACRLSMVRSDINALINHSARRVHADNKLIPLMYENSDGVVLPATYQFIFSKLKESHLQAAPCMRQEAAL